MRHPARPATRLTLVVVAAVAMIVPAVGQDRMVLGPRQFEQDKSGAGAVLCSWSIYLSIQNQVAACALPRRPVDDAIDQAIVAIDEFILANSSLHPTKPMLEAFKRNAAEFELRHLRQRGLEQACASPDLEMFRRPSPEKVQATVKALLAIPREPVMNPCL
jgi:hypothetical protein